MEKSSGRPAGTLGAWGRPDPVVLGILALSLVASLLVVARTWEFGIGLSPDSVAYVSMARGLATGHDALSGEHLQSSWPPLFTLLISAPGVAGIDPIAVGAFLNPLILVCICLVAGLWLYRRTDSGFIGIVVTAALAFSIPLTRASSFVWTEPLFVLLTVCSLALLDRHLRDDSIMALVFAAMLAALACLTRYAGVALLAATVLLVLCKPQTAPKKRAAQTLVYSVVAALPLFLWLARNYLLAGTFTGGRTAGIYSLAENAERVVMFFGVWALPWGRPDYDLSVFVSVLPFVAVVGFALVWAWSSSRSRGVRETLSCLNLSDPFVRVLGVYAVVYIAFILIVSTAVRIDRIHDRLLVPAFVPLALIAGFVVERLIAMSRSDRGRRFGVAFAAAVVLYAASHVAVYIPELRYAAQHGHGYASSKWQTSASIAWARRAEDKRLLSNRADALYLLVPGVAAEWLPRGDARLPDTLSSIDERRVVWFHGSRYPYDLSDLASNLGLQEVAEFDDGVIFEASQPQRAPNR